MAVLAYFDTRPIPASIDPEGGYTLQLKDRPIVDEDDVYEEVRQEYSLPISAKLISFVTNCVLTGMTKKVAYDCNPRKLGNLLKFTPTLRGKVANPGSAYDKTTCSSAITVSSLSGLEKSVDETRVTFINTRDTGSKVTISRVAYVGAQVDSVIKKGKQILATGSNLQYLTGDSVTATYVNVSGTAVVVNMVPSESDVNHMLFAWPEELTAAVDNSEVVLTFKTRGGIESGDEQTNLKKVTVLPADTPAHEPEITSVKGEGEAAGTIAVHQSCTLTGNFEAWESGNVFKLKMAKKSSAGGGYVETDAFTDIVISSDYTTATAKVPNYTESLGDLETTGAEVIWFTADGGTARAQLTNVNVSLP